MHLGPEQLSSYLAGTLSTDEATAVETHIDGCASCRELLSDTVRARYEEHVALASTKPTEQVPLPVATGDVVDGRYRIERLLGVGGMGCVFEAHHQALNQRVALKFMLPQYAQDRSAVDRFTREARAAVRLVTEHVGRVLDLGALPSGTPFLVMELLVGETVEHRLQREGPFPRDVALRVMADTLDALTEAHALGIIHRDLKPANLFLARRSSGAEVLKVLDFGVAKSVHPDIEAGLGSTSAAMIVGSPLYMAPEQLVSGRPIDARADLWAVGCTLYQVLSGQLPFQSADLVELMYAIQSRPHVPLAKLKPQLAEVSSLIDECLAKEPHRRPATAAALKARLEALATGLPTAPQTSSKRSLALGLLAAAGLLGAGAFFGLRRLAEAPVGPPPAPAPAPARLVVEPPPTPPPLEQVAVTGTPDAGATTAIALPSPPARHKPVRHPPGGAGGDPEPRPESVLDERL